MIIEQAKVADVSDVSKIHVTSWQEVYDFIPEEVHQERPISYRERQWCDVIDTDEAGSRLFVLKTSQSGSIVGFCYCKPNEDSDIDAASELHAAYVMPNFRGGVTGPLMMATMLRYLIRCDLTPICLWAFDANPVVYWYRSLGWKCVVKRQRIIKGIGIDESGFICPNPDKLLRRLDRIIALKSLSVENQPRC